MLTNPLPARSSAPAGRSWGPLGLTAALALGLPLGLAGLPAAAQGVNLIPRLARPQGLVVLEERQVRGGKQATGVYGVTTDPGEPGLRRIKVWEEFPDDVKVRSETIRCTPATPMRITSDGRHLIVLTLNPGGQITPGNRLHHQIWWAACFPEQAGRDPATLSDLARRLGYSGHVVESREVLPGGSR
ncbi:MAG: hypothetical protein ACOVNL_01025 [Prochlorococcaceae cyanobacterium]|jgi:hypothetical protein